MQRIKNVLIVIGFTALFVLCFKLATDEEKLMPVYVVGTNYITITNYMTVDTITIPPSKPTHGTGYFVLRGQGEYYRKDFQ